MLRCILFSTFVDNFSFWTTSGTPSRIWRRLLQVIIACVRVVATLDYHCSGWGLSLEERGIQWLIIQIGWVASFFPKTFSTCNCRSCTCLIGWRVLTSSMQFDHHLCGNYFLTDRFSFTWMKVTIRERFSLKTTNLVTTEIPKCWGGRLYRRRLGSGLFWIANDDWIGFRSLLGSYRHHPTTLSHQGGCASLIVPLAWDLLGTQVYNEERSPKTS